MTKNDSALKEKAMAYARAIQTDFDAQGFYNFLKQDPTWEAILTKTTPKRIEQNLDNTLQAITVEINSNSNRGNRGDQVALALKKAGMSEKTIALGQSIKGYRHQVNTQLQSWINGNTTDLKELLDTLQKGHPDLYGKLKKGIEDYVETGKKATVRDVKVLLKDFNRHHIFTVDMLRESEVFQEIVDWGMQNNRPFEFNQLGKNIILVHNKHHPGGNHPDYSKSIRQTVDRDGDLKKYLGEGNMSEAYDRLVEILEAQTALIKQKSIQEGNFINDIYKQ